MATQAITNERIDHAAHLFTGGGAMGALMASLDWSRTALGPVHAWPQSLRTIVSTCLASRFPILVWWGRDLTMIYNDAYRPVLGDKHPTSMAQRGRECWPEVWHIIGPMLEGVLDRGVATWSEDQMLPLSRHGFTEECYFTFSYSPIRDESGGVGGVFTAVTETTDRVLAERRLGTLRVLGEKVAGAVDVDDACSAALATLAKNPHDVPFAAVYLGEEGGFRRACSFGVDDDVTAPLVDGHGRWRLAEVVASRVAHRVAPEGASLPGGPWPEPAREAFVVPIAKPGEKGAYGALVTGISPRLAFDEAYAGFLELAAQHVASAIANAVAYEQNRKKVDALAELDRAKTAFFANVSHEFRTPLTLMLAPLEDLRAAPRSETDRQALELLHRNALRLLKLVNSLLDFSRAEAGRADASYELTEVSSLTAELASTFRSAIERAGLTLDVDCADAAEDVYVDRAMWEKIVLNLLSNALKHTFEGRIAVGVRNLGSSVELEVRDTGVGIPHRELPHIFDRFHRVTGTRARSHEGSGIGLALVAELVKMHGGEIHAESEEGRGSVFRVRVPTGKSHLPTDRIRSITPPAPPREAAKPFVEEAVRWVATTTDGPSAAPVGVLPRARIVVADDNADMREYVARLLREHWEVEAYADGAEALAAISRRPPDLVLTDVMMPKLDGFALLAALRRDPTLASIPVVLLSARAGNEATEEGLRAGADDYIVKPFTARDLLVRVAARLSSIAATREAAVAREHERHRLLSMLEQVPAIVNFMRGPELVLEFVHPKTLEAVGGRDIVGKPLLEALPEFAHQPFYERMKRVFDTGEPYSQTEEPTWLDIDGRRVETYWSSVYLPVRDEQDRIEGVMTFDLDVTANVRARRELEEASRAKDEFLATMSHELRTPLNAMLGWAAMLQADDVDPEKRKRGLAAIERNANAQSRLVSDLLDVSRIVTGKLRLALKRTDVAAVVASAADVVRPAADAKRVRLSVDLDPELGTTLADPDRLQQVVWNLLSNAVRFTPAGGTVSVRGQRREQLVVIEVEDTGTGIAAQHLVSIFERFRQIDSSATRSHGGLGLGLAIVRHLVEAHGGSVTATSRGIGAGATFAVTLPVTTDAPDADSDAAPEDVESVRSFEATPPADRAVLAGVRVLVVDDDTDSLELLKVVLERAGAVVTSANGARAALEHADGVDVVVSDIAMPETDGYEFIRALRSRTNGSGAPAIALTAYARAEDRDRAREAGFQEHLAKPVNTTKLVDAVRRWAQGAA